MFPVWHKTIALIFASLPGISSLAQDTTLTDIQPDKKRIWLVTGANAAFYTGSLIILNEAWFKDYDKTGFRTFNDSKEWNQVDKVGHAWSGYNLGKYSTYMWKWAGLSHKKAVLAGTITGFTYMTVIEFLDAHSAQWGWSWADIGANVFGSGLYLGQELAWKEQRIQFKFSFHKQSYKEPALQQRADELFGDSWSERLLKDYNGQTYWLSANLRSFFKTTSLPNWLNLSVGYGASGLYGGFENIARDKNGTITFDRRDIARGRQFYIAPDIDLSKIRTKSRFLKNTLLLLNALKFPAPSIEFNTHGKTKFYFLYF